MSVPEITVTELHARLRAGTVALVDVRTPQEYAEAHVAGSVLVPLPEVPDRLAELPAQGDVLVICRSGGRSAVAADFLRAQGVAAVNVAGGILDWIDRGYPVETPGA